MVVKRCTSINMEPVHKTAPILLSKKAQFNRVCPTKAVQTKDALRKSPSGWMRLTLFALISPSLWSSAALHFTPRFIHPCQPPGSAMWQAGGEPGATLKTRHRRCAVGQAQQAAFLRGGGISAKTKRCSPFQGQSNSPAACAGNHPCQPPGSAMWQAGDYRGTKETHLRWVTRGVPFG